MNKLPHEWLVGPTTYQAFLDRLSGSIDLADKKFHAKVAQQSDAVAARMQPGDELWEWRRDGGAFASAGGLAILRGGEVIDWWREWVS